MHETFSIDEIYTIQPSNEKWINAKNARSEELEKRTVVCRCQCKNDKEFLYFIIASEANEQRATFNNIDT